MRNSEDNKDNDVAKLIRSGGMRESVEPAREQRAYDRVSAHWQSVVQDRSARSRPRFQIQQMAVAASVVLAIVVGYLLFAPPPEVPTAVAYFSRVIGSVDIDGGTPEVGDALAPEVQIRTDAGSRAALVLSNGQVLRVDESTEVVALASDRLKLNQGAVYIDSADSHPSASVFIETAYGVANDVGTQFQVRVSDEGLMVGVRDGLVNLSRFDDAEVAIDSGWLYELSADGDGEIRPDDSADQWNWVEAVVPEFDLEGATLHEYLVWYAREKAVSLEWADAASESKAETTLLSGSIHDQSLDDGMQTVRRIAPFNYERIGNSFRVKID